MKLVAQAHEACVQCCWQQMSMLAVKSVHMCFAWMLSCIAALCLQLHAEGSQPFCVEDSWT
jgi:predicted metal-binding membrane protein